MASLNKVLLLGNLTRDPETRYTPKGVPVTEFALAINRNYTTEDGARHEDVTFVDICAWSKTAELIGVYLKKGSQCLIEGRLQLDQWEDKQTGQKRSRIKVVCENVQFLGSKRTEEDDMP